MNLSDEEKSTPLRLVSKSTATTYTFKSDRGCRWACATINDNTSELSIQSDFGNWSYRWGGGGFGGKRPGHKYNLTGFIGERGSGDYLADKLCAKTDEFSPDLTIAALRRKICEARLESGRKFISYYCDYPRDEPYELPEDWEIDNQNEPQFLTKTTARNMWLALGKLNQEGHKSPDIFIDRYCRSPSYDNFSWWITDEPWNYLEYESSFPYQILRDQILPALIRACRENSNA